jgi:trigger factor
MQVTLSRLSPVQVELKVSLPKEKVTTALAKAYADLGRQAQIRGFRKGKVPLPLLKQYFGERVAAEVSGRLVEETLPHAIEQQKLEPVAQPRVDPTRLDESADWTYTAHLEVRPEVGEIVLDDIALERHVYKIDDADVDHQIEHLREENATLRSPDPARPVKAADVVTLDYDVTVDGAPREELNARNRSVEVGKGKLLKELDAGLVGAEIAKPKPITVRFPDDHAREDLRGKDAVLTVTVSEIREKILPELDDEFAKDTGSESLAALKTKIRGDLERQGQETSDGRLREDAVNALVEKNPIAVPPSLVESAVNALSREIAQSLRLRGAPLDVESVIRAAREQAEKRVRAGLLLAELARKNNLDVNEADLNTRIDEMAKATGKAAAKIRADYRDPKRREALANAVLEDKVLALLMSKIKVTDVPSPNRLHDHDHDH